MTTRQIIVLLIIPFALLLSAISLNAQGWKREYPEVSVIHHVAQTPDKGFLACGVDKNGRVAILKTDADGAVLLKRTITEIPSVDNVFLTESNDGNFYIATSSNISSSIEILKVSPKTELIWIKSAPIKLSITDFKQFSDGNLGIAGLGESATPKFIKLNSQADTLWTRTYGNPTGYLPDFAEDINGEIFWKINDLSGRLARSLILRLSKNGNLLETIDIDTQGKSFNKIFRSQDGNWLLYNDREVRKIKGDGTVIWRSLTGYFNLERYIDQAIPTSDGGVMALGVYGTAGNPYRHEFIKINASGDSLYKRVSNQVGTIPFYMFTNMYETSDKGFIITGNIERTDGTSKTELGYLIRANTEGVIYPNKIVGKIAQDKNQNCRIDSDEPGIIGWNIKAESPQGKIFYGTTDSTGAYSIEVDSGRYKVNVLLPNNLWQPCFTDSTVLTGQFAESNTLNIPIKAKTTCANLFVNIGTPLLRRCADNIYTVRYCNQGTTDVDNAYVEIKIDSNLIFQRATLPLTAQNGNTLRFDLGKISVFACDSFQITVKVNCATPSVVGRTLCAEAHIYPDVTCPVWQGANIVVTGNCSQDTISLIVQNTGSKTTTTQVTNVVIVDEVVFLRQNTTYSSGQRQTYKFPGQGRTFRLQTDQEEGNPTNQAPSVTIEGCGTNNQGGISTGYVLQMPEPDGDPFVDIDCQTVYDTYEPNANLPSPVGYRSEHFIDPKTEIDYTLRFQNTGNTPVNTLVIRDTLSEYLDPATVSFGASSHQYAGELIGENVVKFTIKDFILPDSMKNNAASFGYVKFRVKLKNNVALGSKIYNKAALYFDANAPVFTNRSFHTVGKNFLITATVDKPTQKNVAVKIYPNPFVETANFEVNIDPLSKNSIFSVFDLSGRLVRSQQFDGASFQFERQDMNAGLYIFMIENQGIKLATGKLSISEN